MSDVFLSHNSQDKPTVAAIAEHLRERGVEPWLDAWHLVPGEEWQRDLERALEETASCAVFVGPNGISPWQDQEMRTAIDRRVHDRAFRVIPVLLPGADRGERSSLPTFLTSHTWVEFRHGVDDEHALDRLVCAIRGQALISPGEVVLDEDACPYQGLRAFDVEDARFFQGREALTDWLVDDLRPRCEGAPRTRFQGILGPSGSGKSSLARAGLVASLRAGALPGSEDWTYALTRPGGEPLESLAVSLARTELVEKTVSGVGTLARELASDEKTLDRLARLALAEAPPDRRLLVLVDQFEEVFTLCDVEETRGAYLDALLHAASVPDGRVIVVVTLRADFYPECGRYRRLADAFSDHHFLVGPMTEDELRRAVEQPLRMVSGEFEAGLVETILGEVREQPGALPLLQDALLELWRRRRGRRLTRHAYEAMGGVAGALEERAESVYGDLSEDEQTTCRRLLLRLTRAGEGTETTRRRVSMAELVGEGEQAGISSRVLAVLSGEDARLVVLEGDPEANEEVRVEVSHEALLRNWSRLTAWLEDAREFLVWRQRLQAARRDWQETAQDEGCLLRGAALAKARMWILERPDDLLPTECEFIEISDTVERRAEEERRATERRELEAAKQLGEEQRQRAEEQEVAGRRMRHVAIAMTLLTLMTGGFFYRAQIAEEDARRAEAQIRKQHQIVVSEKKAALEARSTAMTAHAEAEAARRDAQHQLGLAFLEKAEALRAERRPLVASLTAARAVGFVGSGSPEIAPRALLTAGSAEWRRARRLSHSMDEGAGELLWSSAPPTGNGLSWASPDEEQTGLRIERENSHAEEFPTAVRRLFFQDGDRQVTALGRDGVLRSYDAANGALLRERAGTPRAHPVLGAPGLRADARELAYPCGVISVCRASVTTMEVSSAAVASGTRAVALSPDGDWLAVAVDNGRVDLWDLGSWPPPPPESRSRGGGRSPVETALASKAGALRSRDLRPRSTLVYPEPTRSIERKGGPVLALAFSPDSQQLATAGRNRTVQLWEVDHGEPLREWQTANAEVTALVFDVTGDQLAWAGDGSEGTVAKIASRHVLKLEDLSGRRPAIAFDGSGDRVAVASDRQVRVYGAQVGELEVVLEGAGRPLRALAFSPGGDSLVAGDDRGVLHSFSLLPARRLRTASLMTRTRPLAVHLHPERPSVLVLDAGETLREVSLGEAEVPESLPLAREGLGIVEDDFMPDYAQMANMAFPSRSEPTRGAISHDGSTAALAYRDGEIHTWDTSSGSRVEVFQLGDEGEVTSLVLSPDGVKLAVTLRPSFGFRPSGSDGAEAAPRVHLLDLRTRKSQPITAVTRPGADVLDFSPDGRLLACGGTDGLDLVEVETGVIRARAELHAREVHFTADARTAVVLTGPGEVQIMETATGTLRKLLPSQSRRSRLAVSKDGELFLTATDDGMLHLRSLEDGHLLISLLAGTRGLDAVFLRGRDRAVTYDPRSVSTLWSLSSRPPLSRYLELGSFDGLRWEFGSP